MPISRDDDGSFYDDAGNVFAPTPAVLDAYAAQQVDQGADLFGARQSFGAPAHDMRLAEAGAVPPNAGDPSNQRPAADTLVSDTSNSPFAANAQPAQPAPTVDPATVTSGPIRSEAPVASVALPAQSDAPTQPVAGPLGRPVGAPAGPVVALPTSTGLSADDIERQERLERIRKLSQPTSWAAKPGGFEPTSRTVQRTEGPTPASNAEIDRAAGDTMIAKHALTVFESEQAQKEAGLREEAARGAIDRAARSKQAEDALLKQLEEKEAAIKATREELEKAKEDPDGYWNSRDAGQKVAWIGASLLSGFGAALQSSSGNGRAQNLALREWDAAEQRHLESGRQNRAARERQAAGLESDYSRSLSRGAADRASRAAESQGEQEALQFRMQQIDAETRAGIKTPFVTGETRPEIEDETYLAQLSSLEANGIPADAAHAAAIETAAQKRYADLSAQLAQAGVKPDVAHASAAAAADAFRREAAAISTAPSETVTLEGAPVNLRSNFAAAQLREQLARDVAAREAASGGQVSESYRYKPPVSAGSSGPNRMKIAEEMRALERLGQKSANPLAAGALGGTVGYGDKAPQTVSWGGERLLLDPAIPESEATKLREKVASAEANMKLADELVKQINDPIYKKQITSRAKDTREELLTSAANVFTGQGAKNNDESERWKKRFDAALNTGDSVAAANVVRDYMGQMTREALKQGVVGRIDERGQQQFNPGTPQAMAISRAAAQGSSRVTIDPAMITSKAPPIPGSGPAPRATPAPKAPDAVPFERSGFYRGSVAKPYEAPKEAPTLSTPKTEADLRREVTKMQAEQKKALDDATRVDRLRAFDAGKELALRMSDGENPRDMGDVFKRIETDMQPLLSESASFRSLFEQARGGNKGAAVALKERIADLEKRDLAKPSPKGGKR